MKVFHRSPQRLIAQQTPSQTACQPSGNQQCLGRNGVGLLLGRNVIDSDIINLIEPLLVCRDIVKIRQQPAPQGEPRPIEVANPDLTLALLVFLREEFIYFGKIGSRIFKLGGIYYQTVGRPKQSIENFVGNLHHIPPPKEGSQIGNQQREGRTRKFNYEIALGLQGDFLAAESLTAAAFVGLKE